MRAVAIFSVICAHCATIIDDTSSWNYTFHQLLTAFGIIGVPLFFWSSGYYFYTNSIKDYIPFFKHKSKSILLPWLVTTTLVYLYIAVRKQGLDLKDYVFFILGFGNYTYFLTVLLVFFLITLKSNFNSIFIAVSIILSIISLILTTTDTLGFLNPYCNPLNWLIYFILGILFRKKNLLRPIACQLSKWWYLYFIFFITISITLVIFKLKIHYWSISGYVYIFLAYLMLLGLITKFNQELVGIKFIGENSLTIFLIHSPFAGVLVNLTNRFNMWYLLPLRPFIILASVLLAISLYRWFAGKLNIEKVCYPLIGLRLKAKK